MVVRGDEHDVRTVLAGRQPRRHVEPRHAGHLDVEEDDVGRQLVDQAQGVDAVGGLVDDAQSGQTLASCAAR